MNSSQDSKIPSEDDLAHEIRAKVAEAEQRQRHLNEAAVRARSILSELRPALDEAAAYMHRETGLDVTTGHAVPVYLLDALAEDQNRRVVMETRDVFVPTVPPTLLQAGYQVLTGIAGQLQILSFWAVGDNRHKERSQCWTDLVDVQTDAMTQSKAIAHAAEVLFGARHQASQNLLDILRTAE